MRVIVRFKDESTFEVPIHETEGNPPTGAQAIEFAKIRLSATQREQVKSYEVEEDFL